MRHVFKFLYLVRIHNLFIASLCVYVASFLLELSIDYNFFICLLVVLATMALGYIMNDILDIKSDKINHSKRPLVNEKIKPGLLVFIIFILLFILVFCSFKLNNIALCFLCCFVLPSLFFYNYFLKKTPLAGNIVISCLLGSVFVFTEMALIGTMYKLYIPFILTVCFSISREMIKDMADYDGDLSVNMVTLPVFIGMKNMRVVIVGWILCLMFILIIPYFFYNYSYEYLLFLILFIEIPLIYSLFLLIKFPTKETYKYLAAMFKILCVNGLLAIMTSKINLYV